MIPYFLRSILCLAILLVVYHLFLEKEKMHRFNRWYLLSSIIFGCLIPLVSFTVPAESLPILQDNYFEIVVSGYQQPDQVVRVPKESTEYLMPSLLIMYTLITSCLLIRFSLNIYRLLSRAASNNVIKYQGARLVLLKEKTASHSFLSNIFINEDDYADQTVEEELITHELTHVRQKHSWDVIFIELLQTIFWFNPLFYFYKKAIQLNHEYLADDAVIKTYENVPAYQYLLLDKASCNNQTYLTSNFNYSVTKKRLVMMTRTTNRAKAFLKKLAVLPILAGALFVFSSKIILAQDKPKAQHVAPWDAPYTQDGISAQELNEYNGIIKKYLYTNENGLESIKEGTINSSDRERLTSLFKKMNKSQQAEAKVGFMKSLPPYPKKIPTQEQFENWKDPAQFGVWLNGYKIRNEELNKYKPAELVYFDISKMIYTEAQKKYILKRYKLDVVYKVKVMVMTIDAYEKHKAARLSAPEYNMFYRVRGSDKNGIKFNSNFIIN